MLYCMGSAIGMGNPIGFVFGWSTECTRVDACTFTNSCTIQTCGMYAKWKHRISLPQS